MSSRNVQWFETIGWETLVFNVCDVFQKQYMLLATSQLEPCPLTFIRKAKTVHSLYQHEKSRLPLMIQKMDPKSQRPSETQRKKTTNFTKRSVIHCRKCWSDSLSSLTNVPLAVKLHNNEQNQKKRKFAEGFDEFLKQFAEKGIYEDLSSKVAPIFPKIVHPCLTSTNNWSLTNALARRLCLWYQGRLDELLLEAKILQYKLHKTP